MLAPRATSAVVVRARRAEPAQRGEDDQGGVIRRWARKHPLVPMSGVNPTKRGAQLPANGTARHVRIRTARPPRLSAFVRRRLYHRRVGGGAALAVAAGMLKMSIRRKLFLAFALVAAISSAALLLLAGSYIRTVRAQLDCHFLEDARAALDCEGAQSEELEQEALDVVENGALDPDMLWSFLADESSWRLLFDRVPGLIQLAVYDARKRIVRAQGTEVDPLQDQDIEAALAGPSTLAGGPVASVDVHPGRTWVVHNSRFLAFARTTRETIVGELDLAQLFRSAALGRDGRVLLVDFKSGKPWLAPDEKERVRDVAAGARSAARPAAGERRLHRCRRRTWTALSRLLGGVGGDVAAGHRAGPRRGRAHAARRALRAVGARFARVVLASVVATLVLALAGGARPERPLRRRHRAHPRRGGGVRQGDWRRLEKSSRDELGGALVDSINEMATAVAERMRREEAESWRSLVRVVSHEINNTLAPIQLGGGDAARLGLQKRLRDDDAGRRRRHGAQADRRARRCARPRFIDGYAEVAKLPPPSAGSPTSTRLVGGAARLFADDAGRRGVALDVRADSAGAVELDAQQMERVLVNLIKNALEAAPRGSAVDVNAARVAGGLEIRVADAGPGISPEARRNLFVPYFTTKPGGSGIGLALARQIVVAHGGTLTAERSPSGGTLMRVVVPEVAHGHPYREAG